MRFQKDTFLIIPNKQKLRGMNPNVQVVYIRLCEYINDDLSCYPSYETIAKSAWCSRSTAIRSIKELVSQWLLRKEPRYRENEQTSNKYYIELIEETVAVWHPPVAVWHHPVSQWHHPVAVWHPELNNITQHINSIDSKESQQSWPPPVEWREEMREEDKQPLKAKKTKDPHHAPPTPPAIKWPRIDIQELIYDIQKTCEKHGIAYNPDKEREFARHILTAKAFWEFAERIGKTRHDMAISVLKASIQINYRKWATSWPRSIYKEYAEVYNAWIQQNKKEQTKKPLHSIWKLC